jgi:N6-L-threonylcarbamoyladenine synthase
MLVYVLNNHGKPLMPCTPRKAKLLLKNNKAKVTKKTPFTIQLLYETPNRVQEVVLGADAGSKIAGFSASTNSKELFSAELTLRNDVVELLSARRALRSSRRNRTTRYRQPRFNNRKKSKQPGWIAPSIRVKIQEHVTIINKICSILPISKVVVETAEFDTQLLKAVETGSPLPMGKDYQQGEMFNYYNVRQYVFFRDNYTCQHCKTKAKNVKLHTHHLESRKVGGDAPNNLITLCEDCHKKYHKGLIELKTNKRKLKSFRDAAFMGIMRNFLLNKLRSVLSIQVIETKGFITKYTIENVLDIDKTHSNDALAIAIGLHGFGNTDPIAIDLINKTYQIKAIRHHNRQLHKMSILKNGIRKLNQLPKYVKGFKLFDKVLYNNTICFIWGRRSSGSFLLRNIDGTKVKDGVGYKHLKLLERSSNYIIN